MLSCASRLSGLCASLRRLAFRRLMLIATYATEHRRDMI